MFYLSCIHLHRQYYDYGSYTLDITGPLMIITQKVTSLAFSIHDGFTRDTKVGIISKTRFPGMFLTKFIYLRYRNWQKPNNTMLFKKYHLHWNIFRTFYISKESWLGRWFSIEIILNSSKDITSWRKLMPMWVFPVISG